MTGTKARTAWGLVTAAAAAIALSQSWKRWLDPIIDTGRDLYIPEQLLRGATLYHDIRYQYPPLAPYLLAGVTRVTGHSLAAYTAIGLVQSLVVGVLLWIIANRLAGEKAAFGAALLFVAFNVAGASTFGANFVFPYSHAATFGIAFLLAAIASLLGNRIPLALAFALAASWCKLEYAAAVLVLVVALAAARMATIRQVVGFVIAAAATVAAAAGYFGFAALRDNIFAPSLTSGAVSKRFYSLVSGTADWKGALLQAALGIAVIAAVEWLRKRNQRLALIAGGAAALLLPINALFRACGILQWGAIARPRDRWVFILAVLSTATTLRIALNVAPIWYGFALVVPLYLLIARVTRGDAVWLLVIAILSIRSLADQRLQYAAKQFPVVTQHGTFYDSNPDRAATLNAALPRIHGGTLAVFPEGIALNYFAAVRSPLSFHTFTPAETKDPAVEARVLAELRQRPPDQVVILSRDVREFGSRGFGVDYDQQLMQEIRSRYAVEETWVRPRFQMALLRRLR